MSAAEESGLGQASLIGREPELCTLAVRIAEAANGRGGMLLISGEAGIGKSALVDAALRAWSGVLVRTATNPGAMTPHAPVIAVLRAMERLEPGSVLRSGPLGSHLSALLPEIGSASANTDRSTLNAAIADAFRALASHGPAVVVLEDVQWCDEATLDLLPVITSAISELPLLFVATSRTEEIHRGHGLRRARAEMKRARLVEEIELKALTAEHTATLVEHVARRPVASSLVAWIFERTGGVPFFVEEITAALVEANRLRDTPEGVAIAVAAIPVPETIRDAVRLRTDRLSESARHALELAAVIGLENDLARLAGMCSDDAVEEVLRSGILVEREKGIAAFRHALLRDALYADIAWTRRRLHHRRVAESLQESGGAPEAIAEHWIAAREPERARLKLMEATQAFCAVHAYRDAARVGRRALDLWPDGLDEAARLAVLDRFGHCAEISGDLAEAARALEEVRDAHGAAGRVEAQAEVSRRLAGIYELQGLPERTRSAREHAAAAFTATGRIADAVAERLAIAERLELSGRGNDALALLNGLTDDIAVVGSVDLRIRALALEGEFRAKLGELEGGVAVGRHAVALALEHGATAPLAEAYYRLGAALENACDHDGAIEAYTTARGFCLGHQIQGLAQVCLACMLPAVLFTGQWSRMIEVCENVLDSPDSPPVARMKAKAHLGIVGVIRGQIARSRRLLEEAYAFSQREQLVPIEVFSCWGLARAAEGSGSSKEALDICREVVRRASARDERHYIVAPLRWASTLFALHGDVRGIASSADLLSKIAASTGHAECLGPLAHALGELALAEGDHATAVAQFEQAMRLLGEAGLPYERAETGVRAAAALSAAGERALAVERLTDAYRVARRLGARPLALVASSAVQALGETVERRLGSRAADEQDGAGLSRREVEVLRLATNGLTNREIADRLFVSKRTVDMHMRNVLARLGCRSRVEAAARARSLQLVP